MATKDDIIKYVQHTPENTNPSVLGGLLSDLQEGKSIQPDWNQNDETAADYVKNRPFYTGKPVETVLVEESTVLFEDSDSGFYIGLLESTFMPTAGENYRVSWDGTVYECTGVYSDGILFIGNMSLSDMGLDTGEPFLMIIETEGITIGTLSTSASHTFSIIGLAPEVVNIDRKYLPAPFRPEGTSYLTFSSPNSFTLEVVGKTKRWDGTLEYFASDGTWATWDGRSVLSAVYDYGEYVLYLRGTGNTGITPTGHQWVLTGTDIMCIGNIENLLDYATVESGEHPSMADSCYYNMFSGCTNLNKAPDLPATTLALGCYNSMFSGCTSLIKAPTLPATTLAKSCYAYMFSGCTSLTQVPALPTTTLVDYCYEGMFSGCTSLIKAPTLPATTLAKSCYKYMFRNCTSLKLSSTKNDEYTQEYRIPSSGNGTTATDALLSMFDSTGGTFTGTPEINTTYYLSSDNMIVRETDIATLNGHVGSMINTAIDKYKCIIPSSTPGSTKKFKITVDDSGTLSAKPYLPEPK